MVKSLMKSKFVRSNNFYLQSYIYGSNIFLGLGYSVSRAGDVNGDGINDIILGASEPRPNGMGNIGAVYIIYGKKGGIPNIDSIENYLFDSTNGFGIYSSDKYWSFGSSISGAGDVNGDEISDIIISIKANPNNLLGGTAYIIYGKKGGIPDITSIENYLSNTKNGFKIYGSNRGWWLGYSISGAGDINGDGVSDIVIGTYEASPNGFNGAGAAYVIYGSKSIISNINSIADYLLNTTNGFRIHGFNEGWELGHSVSGVGDINGDGISDIIIGAYEASPNGFDGAGAAYVIYGNKNNIPNIYSIESYLSNTTNGFKIYGSNQKWYLGASVSGAGDVNNDGLNDIVIGTYNANPNNLIGAGAAYVIYGKKGIISSITSIEDYLSNTTNGFKIYGSNKWCELGYSALGVGDVNSDGISDIAIGAPGSNPNNITTGTVYIIYGSKSNILNIDSIENYLLNTTNGFKIYGSNLGWLLGYSISEVGDIDGEGTSEIVLGAYGARPNGIIQTGAAYIIYGNSYKQNYGMFSKGNGTFFSMNNDNDLGYISIGSNAKWCKAESLYLGDFNGDKMTDLLCNSNGGKNYIMLSEGIGTSGSINFKPMNASDVLGRISIGSNYNWCDSRYQERLLLGDFNGDNKVDLLCNNIKEQNYVMLSTGVNFKPMASSPDGAVQVGRLPGTFCGQNTDLIIGNFDGKYGDDLLCKTGVGFSLMVYNSTTFVPFDNSYEGMVTMQISYALCNSGWINLHGKIITGDFNGDGKTDLLGRYLNKNYILVSSVGEKRKGAVCDFSAIQCSPGYGGDNKCNTGGIINIPDGNTKDWCSAPATIRLGDMNADGISDLICNDKGYNTIILTARHNQGDNMPDYYRFESIHGDRPNDHGNITIAGHEKWCLSGDLFIGNFSQHTVSDLWCNQNGPIFISICNNASFIVDTNSNTTMNLTKYVDADNVKLYSLPKSGILFDGAVEAKIGNIYDVDGLKYQAENNSNDDSFQYTAIGPTESTQCTASITIFAMPTCSTASFQVNTNSSIAMNLTNYVNVANVKLYSLPKAGILLNGEIEVKIGDIYDVNILQYKAGKNSNEDCFQYTAINKWMESVQCTIDIEIEPSYNEYNLFWLLVPAVITVGVVGAGIRHYCNYNPETEYLNNWTVETYDGE